MQKLRCSSFYYQYFAWKSWVNLFTWVTEWLIKYLAKNCWNTQVEENGLSIRIQWDSRCWTFFFNVGLPLESIFLTTIYGLYFSHHYKLHFLHGPVKDMCTIVTIPMLSGYYDSMWLHDWMSFGNRTLQQLNTFTIWIPNKFCIRILTVTWFLWF